MFLVTFVLLLSTPLQTIFTEAVDPSIECMDIENIQDKDAFEFFTQNLSIAENKPRLKCYAACCLEFMRALQRGCNYQPESGKKYVIDNGLRKDMLSAYDACHNSTTSVERCQCGFDIYKCIAEYMDLQRNDF